MTEEQSQIFATINTASAYANLVLTGTSGFAISQVSCKENPFAYTALCCLCAHGLIGLLEHLHTSEKGHEYIKKLSCCSNLIVHSLPLPTINAQLAIKDNQEQIIINSFLASAASVPVCQIGRLFSEQLVSTNTVSDLCLLGNITALAFNGVAHEDYLAIGLAAWSLLSRFLLPVIDASIYNDFDVKTWCLSGMSLILWKMFGTDFQGLTGEVA